MQYFSIVAYVNDGPGRTCAMLPGASLDDAAVKARNIIRAEHLNFVERRARFSVRRSSRRETSLLQSYLASCGRANLESYLKTDIDALMWRRGNLLLSFFMALYLKPEILYRRFSPLPAGSSHSPPSSTGGSGGRTMEALETETGGSSLESSHPEQSQQTSQTETNTTRDSDAPPEAGAESPIGNDNQLSALDDIVNAPAEGGDEKEVDLGDIF